VTSPSRPAGPRAVTKEAAGRHAGARDRDAGPNVVDDFLDELFPRTIDWRLLVRQYPHAAIAVAVTAGFWLGRRKSALVLAAAGSYLAAQVGEAAVGLGHEPSRD
jgi:hypothetical protein